MKKVENKGSTCVTDTSYKWVGNVNASLIAAQQSHAENSKKQLILIKLISYDLFLGTEMVEEEGLILYVYVLGLYSPEAFRDELFSHRGHQSWSS